MTQDNRSPRILIVDDEESILHLLGQFLTTQGYCSDLADSGEAALSRLLAGQFDIMLCDIQMPGISGLDLLHEVTTQGIDTTVVLVSGLDDIRRATNAMRLGAYDYIVKPFELEEVELSIERALEHRRLIRENRAYQSGLEQLVAERTGQLEQANAALREKGERLAHSVEELYCSYRITLGALAGALDLRDNETKGHSERVVAYSLRLGRQLGLVDADMMALEMGALLHDVGKIGVRDAVLLKPGKLTPAEWVEMRMHITYGENIVRNIPFLHGALPVISQHHEYFDGSGYPQGLKGEEIHINARIFSVADTLDSMTSDRPYRNALSFEQAREEIQRYVGLQYDPIVAEAFFTVPLDDWRWIRRRTDEMQSLQLDYVPDFQTFDLWNVLTK